MKSIFQIILKQCKAFLVPQGDFKQKTKSSPRKGGFKATPAERQKQLEAACDLLFSRQDLIVSGKLQMLGIQQIQQKFAQRWPYIQQEVYSIIGTILKDHLDQEDVFFRYREEGYIVLFAKKNQEDAQATLSAIAFAIRKALLESEEDAVQEINIQRQVGHIYSKHLKNQQTTPESLGAAFQENKDSSSASKLITNKKDIPKPKSTEVDPIEQAMIKLNHCFMPLCAPSNTNSARFYMLLAQGKSAGDNPFDKHNMFFLGMNPNERQNYDFAFLNIASITLKEMFQESLMQQIICPIHYETLTHVKAIESFIIQCQKIPDEQKKKIIFCIYNFPSEFNPAVVKKSVSQLKPHCASLATILQSYKTLDLETFASCGFNIMGYRIKNAQMAQENKIIDSMQDFSSRMKKHNMQTFFALDVPNQNIAETAQKEGYTLISGEELSPHRKSLLDG